MQIDSFCRELCTRLDVEVPHEVDPAIELHDDLGLDSVQVYEVIIISEVLADCLVPPMDMPGLHTLGDAYAYYEHCRRDAIALFGD